jgi:hypothetical protein
MRSWKSIGEYADSGNGGATDKTIEHDENSISWPKTCNHVQRPFVNVQFKDRLLSEGPRQMSHLLSEICGIMP